MGKSYCLRHNEFLQPEGLPTLILNQSSKKYFVLCNKEKGVTLDTERKNSDFAFTMGFAGWRISSLRRETEGLTECIINKKKIHLGQSLSLKEKDRVSFRFLSSQYFYVFDKHVEDVVDIGTPVLRRKVKVSSKEKSDSEKAINVPCLSDPPIVTETNETVTLKVDKHTTDSKIETGGAMGDFQQNNENKNQTPSVQPTRPLKQNELTLNEHLNDNKTKPDKEINNIPEHSSVCKLNQNWGKIVNIKENFVMQLQDLNSILELCKTLVSEKRDKQALDINTKDIKLENQNMSKEIDQLRSSIRHLEIENEMVRRNMQNKNRGMSTTELAGKAKLVSFNDIWEIIDSENESTSNEIEIGNNDSANEKNLVVQMNLEDFELMKIKFKKRIKTLREKNSQMEMSVKEVHSKSLDHNSEMKWLEEALYKEKGTSLQMWQQMKEKENEILTLKMLLEEKSDASQLSVYEEFRIELICSICTNIFKKPLTLNCGHTFCYVCINNWKKRKMECPSCRACIEHETHSLALSKIVEKCSKNCE